MHERLHLAASFCSLVLLPFVAFLRLFRVRVLPALAAAWVIYLLAGLIVIGGGVTPMDAGDFGPGPHHHVPVDIVTREESQAWFSSAFVHTAAFMWLRGLGIGIPLLLITWLHEYRKTSVWLHRFDDGVTVFTFVAGFWEFITTHMHR
jgi:hypothetical protein